jgi:hypothetical protein
VRYALARGRELTMGGLLDGVRDAVGSKASIT